MRSSTPLEFDTLFRRLDQAEERLARGLSSEERDQLLARRTAALAARLGQTQAASMSVIAFQLGAERYGTRAEEVEQVLPIRGLSPLAGAPRHVLGAVVARSRILPVLDLRQLLGLNGRNASDLTAVIAVRINDELFGLAAEAVEGRCELPVSELETAPAGPFHCLAPGRLAVLDLERLLGDRDVTGGD